MEFSKIVRDNLGNYIDSFYLAVKHNNEKYIDEYIQKFLNKTLTVLNIFYTKETSLTTHKESDGEHFHFVVVHSGDNEILNKKITNSLMRHYVNKYNLAGNSKGTRVRQYGLIRKSIKSVANLLRYVTKETNIVKYFSPVNGDIHLHEEIQQIIQSLPKWETHEEQDSVTFFNSTLEEIRRQPPDILNNDYLLIIKILEIYNLANKHPPIKSTMDKYLRIIHYGQMPIHDFITKYYL